MGLCRFCALHWCLHQSTDYILWSCTKYIGTTIHLDTTKEYQLPPSTTMPNESETIQQLKTPSFKKYPPASGNIEEWNYLLIFLLWISMFVLLWQLWFCFYCSFQVHQNTWIHVQTIHSFMPKLPTKWCRHILLFVIQFKSVEVLQNPSNLSWVETTVFGRRAEVMFLCIIFLYPRTSPLVASYDMHSMVRMHGGSILSAWATKSFEHRRIHTIFACQSLKSASTEEQMPLTIIWVIKLSTMIVHVTLYKYI